MIFIENIKIKDKTYVGSHVLDKKFKIKCSDVNLLVGNQGCGKSTLLKLLQENHSDIEIKLSKNIPSGGVSTFYFDSEKDNPRVKDPELFTKPSGESIGIGYGGAVASRFKSHGEVLETFIIDPLLEFKDCVILLDEPESGLSITNQFKFINAINTAVENNCQFFIATHCYPLIQAFDVISLEHKKHMSGIEFIDKLREESEG